MDLSADSTVVTDDQGRFTWNAPESSYLFARTGAAGPECEAIPDDMGSWRTAPAIAPQHDAANAMREILEHDAQSCVTKWTAEGGAASFSVVAPEMGTVTLRLRGPNGKALANHAVEVAAANQWFGYSGVLVHYGVTDNDGRLRMRRYAGLTYLQIVAPGAGFGSTGYFNTVANNETTLETPPLARLASISGVVDPALRTPGAFITIAAFGFGGSTWYHPKAAIDAQGRFTLTDLLAGDNFQLSLADASPSNSISVNLKPGEEVTEFKIQAPTHYTSYTEPPPTKASTPATPSVRGHVRDTAGHPAAGVDVYALCTYYGFHGAIQQTRTAKTDAEGAYLITDLPNDANGISVVLFAAQSGHPLAFARAESDTNMAATGVPPSKFHGDLIVPDGKSGLIVRVLQQGKPLPGAQVSLAPHWSPGSDGFVPGRGFGGGDSTTLNALLQPAAATNADGEATFEHLTPGLWNIGASFGSAQATNGATPTLVTGSESGAAVGSDEMHRFTLNVHARPDAPLIRILDASGQPLARTTMSVLSGPVNDGLNWFSSINPEPNGDIKLMTNDSGLWRISPRYRDIEADGVSLSVEPIYAGDGYLAISPAISAHSVTFRTAARVGGRLRIRSLDAQGKPSPGAVVLKSLSQGGAFFASIDDSGETVFSGLPSGQYSVQLSWGRPQDAPKFGQETDPFPQDAALTDVQIFSPHTVTIASGEETQETFQAVRQGYIRGKITGADDPKNYWVSAHNLYYSPELVKYDRTTGEFLAGPFPAGKTTLRVQRQTRDSMTNPATGGDWPIDVTPGKVVHATLTPAPPTNQPAPKAEPQYDPSFHLSDSIFLADGVTPAWGAQVAIFVPGSNPPIYHAQVDAEGKLVRRSDLYYTPLPPKEMSGSPTEPVIITWLPGTSGATITPFTPGENKRLTLRAPIAVHGRVTVGGQSVDALPSAFRVLAVAQGRGQLNSLMSFDITTQADGSFDLKGLTPGTYIIQAARDNIWLSETQTLTVGDTPLSDLVFNIAPPGAPAILHVTDKHGKPLAGKSIHVARPAGPLTDLLWPNAFPVDSAGDVRLEGLEAGPHQIGLPDAKPNTPLSKAFTVPAYADGGKAYEASVEVPG
ncbi:hypothetical protein CCAX7_56780 [Capsulimonas corticalis]|uniref:Uncharacterized protein n=2 Tax=Capsulimonas corticalis TaxID=2219043 RepID=A0A402D0E4_9BACT|nr:hypothetical protein CCAX7_56780 [Capsulimonas corticalis]